jgi:hypothetical protein
VIAAATQAPRVIGARTSMALTAVQPHARYDEAGYTGEALRIFDKVPGWAIVHAQRDGSMAPLIREGEVAVVESDGKPGLLPQEGNLYLIQHNSPPYHGELYGRTTRDIVMPRFRRGSWWVGPLSHTNGRTIFMSDGPYPENCELLASKLIGRVVGIYNPSALAAGGSL